jgi:hypothetical protein
MLYRVDTLLSRSLTASFRSLPSASLVDQALAVLTSASSDDVISESLLDIFGFDRIELVGEAISRRASIKEEARQRDENVCFFASAVCCAGVDNRGPRSLLAHWTAEKTRRRLLFRNAVSATSVPKVARRVGINRKPKSYFRQWKKSMRQRGRAMKRGKQLRNVTGRPRPTVRLGEEYSARHAVANFKAAGAFPYSLYELERLREESLEAAANRPLYSSNRVRVIHSTVDMLLTLQIA